MPGTSCHVLTNLGAYAVHSFVSVMPGPCLLTKGSAAHIVGYNLNPDVTHAGIAFCTAHMPPGVHPHNPCTAPCGNSTGAYSHTPKCRHQRTRHSFLPAHSRMLGSCMLAAEPASCRHACPSFVTLVSTCSVYFLKPRATQHSLASNCASTCSLLPSRAWQAM